MILGLQESNKYFGVWMISQARTYLLRKLFKYSQERLEHQFSNGKWDWLENVDESARYALIANFHRLFHQQRGEILDVGCGQGILAKRLTQDCFSTYLGLDFSPSAIEMARAHFGDSQFIHFIQADASVFETKHRFDSIIFNESLYYIPNAIETLLSYRNYLSENGLFIISLLEKDSHQNLKQNILRQFHFLDHQRISNQHGTTWDILVCR